MTQPFVKMHGLGNDFVVLDARQRPIPLSPEQVRRIADRRFGVGCDQLITLEPSRAGDVFMRIRNPDGSEAEACGNATRCITRMLLDETGKPRVAIETLGGLLIGADAGDARISVDMGQPKLGWREIPIAREMDTLSLAYSLGPLAAPGAVNMGNPHAVFVVEDADAIPLADLGPKIEHDPLFPERVNVSVASPLGPGRYRLRVWERGAGLTMACGSAACATVVTLKRRGLVDGPVELLMDGGPLTMEWRADGHVMMTGGTAVAFHGELDPSLLRVA